MVRLFSIVGGLFSSISFIILLTRLALDLVLSAIVLLYSLARGFLVVESFINLTHLPDSAYQVSATVYAILAVHLASNWGWKVAWS